MFFLFQSRFTHALALVCLLTISLPAFAGEGDNLIGNLIKYAEGGGAFVYSDGNTDTDKIAIRLGRSAYIFTVESGASGPQNCSITRGVIKPGEDGDSRDEVNILAYYVRSCHGFPDAKRVNGQLHLLDSLSRKAQASYHSILKEFVAFLPAMQKFTGFREHSYHRGTKYASLLEKNKKGLLEILGFLEHTRATSVLSHSSIFHVKGNDAHLYFEVKHDDGYYTMCHYIERTSGGSLSLRDKWCDGSVDRISVDGKRVALDDRAVRAEMYLYAMNNVYRFLNAAATVLPR